MGYWCSEEENCLLMILRLTQMNADLCGEGHAVVKYVFEGHDRGVNWAKGI
jgi:hypothetical protein